MTSGSASWPGCDLLVSVRDASEAKVVLELGVQWIDLKDPSQGALGAADPKTACEVAEILKDHRRKSAALGELVHLNLEYAMDLATKFPILKLGLANIRGNSQLEGCWQDHIQHLNDRLAATAARLVPVIYADWQQCRAIPPEHVLRCARKLSSPYVLIDTYFKNGCCLTDHLRSEQLRPWINTLRAHECQMVLAGSLRLEHVRLFGELPVAALGVRGGVCSDGREGNISPEKVVAWMDMLATLPHGPERNLPNSENSRILFR